MRNYLPFMMALMMFVSCDSSGDDSLMNPKVVPVLSEPVKGEFVSDAHPTTGSCTVNEDQSKLSITNFKTDEGPRLLMYLSTSVDSQDFVSLGDLKGLEGNFVYDIPENTDLEKYKFVVVWCVDFSVSFGHAQLK